MLGVAGVAAVVLCCALPAVVAGGAIATIAGIGLWNWAVVTVGVAALSVGGWEWCRRRRRRRTVDAHVDPS